MYPNTMGSKSRKKASLKSSFEEYFTDLIGTKEAEQFFCAINEKQVKRGLRVNTLKTSKKELAEWLESQGYVVHESAFSQDGLQLEGRGQPLALKLPYYAGFTYPQDLSSMFAVELLDPQPGELALDLTAAPGGKTTHIAQKMKNTGVVFANDMDSRRLKALHSNLERLGIWNVLVMRTTAHKLSRLYPENFDRILLDPSCSGEGLLVTYDGKPDFWNQKAMKRYSAEQFGLLCSAFALLKPGGRLVYSTCTLNDVEDDGVVDRLLEKFPEAKIEEAVNVLGDDGVPEQIARSDGSKLKGVRFWPHKTGTKGFFCIAITKTEPLGEKIRMEEDAPAEKFKAMNEKQLQRFRAFVKNNFECDLPDADFTFKDQQLFAVSKDLDGFPLRLRVSFALPFLEIVRDEIRPTHAGALWLVLHAKKGIEELNREEVERLFEKEVVSDKIVRYDKFPLGFGKMTKYN